MTHENVELTRRGYRAFAESDIAALDELIADDAVWHVPGDNDLSGDYRGKDEVFGMFGRLSEETGGSFRFEVHDVLANDEHAVVLAEAFGERDGRTLDGLRQVHVAHLEDGQITEFWNYVDDESVFDDFWGG